MTTIVAKTCTGCHRSLPISSFWRHRASRDGHVHRCRECQTGRRRASVSTVADPPVRLLKRKPRAVRIPPQRSTPARQRALQLLQRVRLFPGAPAGQLATLIERGAARLIDAETFDNLWLRSSRAKTPATDGAADGPGRFEEARTPAELDALLASPPAGPPVVAWHDRGGDVYLAISFEAAARLVARTAEEAERWTAEGRRRDADVAAEWRELWVPPTPLRYVSATAPADALPDVA